MKILKLFYLLLFLLIFSCNNNSQTEDSNIDSNFVQISIKYAKGFQITEFKTYKKLTVNNPWQGAKNISYEYYLIDENQEIPKNLENKYIIKTPVQKIVCLSTTHIGFIDMLDAENSIVGIGGADYIYNPKLRKRIAEKKILDVGSEQNINLELLISLKPEVVFIYGISENITNKITELQTLGINVVIIGEYLENEPLGKTEWCKFFAEFFQKKELAEEKFINIADKYNTLKKITDTINSKPGVLVNIPFQGIWYAPGGNSYFAKLIKDAGGNYLWADNKNNEAFPVDFETVFSKQSQADFLLNTNSVNSISEILQIEQRIENFNCIKQKKVYNNNAKVNKTGGNDFWESGVVSPHLILHDLINIFYPNIFLNDSLYYYKKLK